MVLCLALAHKGSTTDSCLAPPPRIHISEGVSTQYSLKDGCLGRMVQRRLLTTKAGENARRSKHRPSHGTSVASHASANRTAPPCPPGTHFDRSGRGSDICRNNAGSGWTCPNDHTKLLVEPYCVLNACPNGTHDDHSSEGTRICRSDHSLGWTCPLKYAKYPTPPYCCGPGFAKHPRLAICSRESATAAPAESRSANLPPQVSEDLCSSSATPLDLNLAHFTTLPLDRVFGGCYPLAPVAFQRSLKTPPQRDERLRRVIAKVSQGRGIVVVVIGGSVACGTTEKGKCGVALSSSSLFVKWLRKQYPGLAIDYHNLAHGGTTSQWLAARMEMVASLNPDLVMYDYSTNDFGKFEPDTLRSTTEGVARGVLGLPSGPALMQLSLFRGVEDGGASAATEAFALEPVARLYNYTLVSYREAVWPDPQRPPDVGSGLFDMVAVGTAPSAVHPKSYIHQIIADLFAFAWTVAEAAVVQLPSALPPTLPVDRFFPDTAVEILGSCAKPLTSLSHGHGRGHLLDAPIAPPPRGWSYFDGAQKEGWQFELGAGAGVAPSAPSKQPAPSGPPGPCAFEGHATAPNATDEPLHRFFGAEAISFRMQFGPSNPRLFVSYLRSYENFGKAVVVIDCDEQRAAELLAISASYIAQCKSFNEFGDDDESLSQACKDILNGRYESPFVLDGHWDDTSSQTAVAVLSSGYTVFPIPIHSNLYRKNSQRGDYNVPMPDPKVPLVEGSGWHTVSIAFLREETLAVTMERPRFKILGLKSC